MRKLINLNKTKHFYIYIALVIALIASIFFSISMGYSNISFVDLSKIILHKLFNINFVSNWSKNSESIIWEIRVPRTILAIIVGAGLASVGVALQSIMRNNLADPHLFGISSGGALGAVSTILLLGDFAGLYSISIGAFIGSMLAILLIMAIASNKKQLISSERLLLSGVSCSFILISLTNLIIFMGEHHSAPSILFWMLGGLGLASWEKIFIPFVVVSLAIIYLYLHSKTLNVMMSGEETSITLGINTVKSRMTIFIVCAMVIGVIVAVSGAIGFIGLITPHISRFIIGADNKPVLIISSLLGSIFLLLADINSRLLFAPQEIPVGIITSFVGGIFFVLIMKRKTII